ncbi:hypothetical protein RRG08_057978 [Elysia crispata]|uniref:Uncharacterized protein n=1 Tax=Elysia crispata TaxID=231223 RepID=A0AAE1AH86_9GAST|nr:hypothetical protein RRG08_057978 [Elysia crispata]
MISETTRPYPNRRRFDFSRLAESATTGDLERRQPPDPSASFYQVQDNSRDLDLHPDVTERRQPYIYRSGMISQAMSRPSEGPDLENANLLDIQPYRSGGVTMVGLTAPVMSSAPLTWAITSSSALRLSSGDAVQK